MDADNALWAIKMLKTIDNAPTENDDEYDASVLADTSGNFEMHFIT